MKIFISDNFFFSSANPIAIFEVILDRFQEINFCTLQKWFAYLSDKDRHVLFMIYFLCEFMKVVITGIVYVQTANRFTIKQNKQKQLICSSSSGPSSLLELGKTYLICLYSLKVNMG